MSWDALAEEYAGFHRSRGNRLCHAIGIPLILLAIVRWTTWRGPVPLPAAALALPLYFSWDRRLGVAMAGAIAALAALASRLGPSAALAAFVAGWTLQAIGHAWFERASPAFSRNLVHLLVGPAWILREASRGTL